MCRFTCPFLLQGLQTAVEIAVQVPLSRAELLQFMVVNLELPAQFADLFPQALYLLIQVEQTLALQQAFDVLQPLLELSRAARFGNRYILFGRLQTAGKEDAHCQEW